MHVLVENLQDWWAHIASLDLASRYGVASPRPPKLEPWGLLVAYVFDPSGVLWHFAELPAGRPGRGAASASRPPHCPAPGAVQALFRQARIAHGDVLEIAHPLGDLFL